MMRMSGGRTPVFAAVFDHGGALSSAIADMNTINEISPHWVRPCATLAQVVWDIGFSEGAELTGPDGGG